MITIEAIMITFLLRLILLNKTFVVHGRSVFEQFVFGKRKKKKIQIWNSLCNDILYINFIHHHQVRIWRVKAYE